MTPTDKTIVTAFDVGTTHLTVLVARTGEDTSVLGATSVPCTGMRKGAMVNLDAVTNAIHDALDEAERQTGLEILDVRVAVSGAGALFDNLNEEITLRSGEVKASDVEKLAGLVRAHKAQAGSEFIHLIPGDFLLDGKAGVTNPLGMFGSQLSLIHHRVRFPSPELKNLLRAFNNAGLKVGSFGFESLTAAEGVLTPDEKELGVLSVNLGASLTHIAVYAGRVPLFSRDLALAAHHVTKDLAIGLRTTLAEAERVKREHGAAFPATRTQMEPIEIQSVDQVGSRFVPREEVCRIVEARQREIFVAVAQELRQHKLMGVLGKGVVLSGGGALLAGAVPLAEAVLGVPCRLGLPLRPSGITELLRTPSAATVFGLTTPLFAGVHSASVGMPPSRLEKGGLLNLSKSLFSRIVDPFV